MSSGGPVEIAVRFRCAECGEAVEKLSMANAPEFPAKFRVDVTMALPAGYTADGGKLHCPAHEPKQVVPVAVMPPAGALRVV